MVFLAAGLWTLSSAGVVTAVVQPPGYTDFRGVILGGTAAEHLGASYYDIFVSINGGDPCYYASVPGTDAPVGYLFHYFAREGNSYTFYTRACDTHGYAGPASPWSEQLDTAFVTESCPANTVPIADAGEDRVVTPGTPVSLDAGGSYDLYAADTPNLTYYWECYAAPEDVALSDPHAVSPTFTPQTAGRYCFRLHVRDEIDGSDFNRSAIRYVQVFAEENVSAAVISRPSACRNVPVGSAVVLDGSSSMPATGDYRWKCLKGSALIENADQPVASFTPTEPGAYVMQLTVYGEEDYSSRIIVVSVYNPAAVGALHVPEIDANCVDPSIGDLDHDLDADGTDLAAFAAAFNSSRGLAGYRADCDFDRSLRTDRTDLAILAACLGK